MFALTTHYHPLTIERLPVFVAQEFDLVLDPSLPPKARLAAQREGLKKRLGLDKDMGLDPDELFRDEDLEAAEDQLCGKQLQRQHSTHSQGLGGGAGGGNGGGGGGSKQAAQELLMNMEGLSARERNRLKRKAKALSRSDSMRVHPGEGPGGRNKVRRGGERACWA